MHPDAMPEPWDRTKECLDKDRRAAQERARREALEEFNSQEEFNEQDTQYMTSAEMWQFVAICIFIGFTMCYTHHEEI